MLGLAPRRVRLAGGQRHLRLAARVTADRAELDIQKMAPLADRLLVKPAEQEQVSAGGILLPTEGAQTSDAAQIGEVVAVGDKVEMDIAKGDTVLYSKYGTADVEMNEGKVVFVRAESVLGVCA